MSRIRQPARGRPRLDIPLILAASALPSSAAAQTKTDSSEPEP